MAVTVSGTSITFNDATVQTTAATAPTTATVLSATAGASVGAVGSYAFLSIFNYANSNINFGTTVAGSGLRYAGGLSRSGSGGASISATSPSGTWRAMGQASSAACGCALYVYGTVFLRIS